MTNTLLCIEDIAGISQAIRLSDKRVNPAPTGDGFVACVKVDEIIETVSNESIRWLEKVLNFDPQSKEITLKNNLGEVLIFEEKKEAEFCLDYLSASSLMKKFAYAAYKETGELISESTVEYVNIEGLR